MDAYYALCAFIFGTILGSFINALSFRFNTGRSIAHGRSRCMTCNHELSALDLVPIFSWVFLRGRCRYCGSKISVQYPLVEAAAGIISALVYMREPQVAGYFYWLLVWMVLLFVVVYDMRHTVIPWRCTGILAALALLSLFCSFGSGIECGLPPVNALVAGPLLALPLFLLSLVSRGRWMGWGDSGLELTLGWFLGAALGATALMFAFWTGAFVGIALILFSRIRWHSTAGSFTMISEIPFAPFLIFGAMLTFFFHVDIFSAFYF